MLNARPTTQTCYGHTRKASQTLPAWVIQRTKPNNAESAPVRFVREGSVVLTTTETGDLLLVSACIIDAASLLALELQRQTTLAYNAVHRILRSDKKWQPVRMWNWVPGIHTKLPGDVDRYMVFNAGRYCAYHDWYSEEMELETSIATATAVGHDRSDLVIHVLATDRPGIPIKNPRQSQSYRYSNRFGPMPPCFARATLTSHESADLPDLLLGGTSSVCGENSIHDGDVAAQTQETLINMAHLIAAGRHYRRNGSSERNSTPDPHECDISEELARFESLRIFHAKTEDATTILGIVCPYMTHLDPHHIELVQAEICRPELLVEIEGTATLHARSQTQSSRAHCEIRIK